MLKSSMEPIDENAHKPVDTNPPLSCVTALKVLQNGQQREELAALVAFKFHPSVRGSRHWTPFYPATKRAGAFSSSLSLATLLLLHTGSSSLSSSLPCKVAEEKRIPLFINRRVCCVGGSASYVRPCRLKYHCGHGRRVQSAFQRPGAHESAPLLQNLSGEERRMELHRAASPQAPPTAEFPPSSEPISAILTLLPLSLATSTVRFPKSANGLSSSLFVFTYSTLHCDSD
ncbi:hypothetical protein MHYP_G00331200 [Metynnis hypsauchen]